MDKSKINDKHSGASMFLYKFFDFSFVFEKEYSVHFIF